MDSTQKQVASLGQEPQRTDPGQVSELQSQLETLRSKMRQMEALERSFSESQRQLEVSRRRNGGGSDAASPNAVAIF